MERLWWLGPLVLLAGVVIWRLVAAKPAPPKPAALPKPDAPPERPKVLPGDHMGTPLFPAVEKGRWGYIDKSGRFVITPQYAHADPFSQNLAFVTDAADGRLLCIDKNNVVKFELKNPQATGWVAPEGGFQDGFALVVLQGVADGNKYTYVSTSGALLGPPRFWPAHPFSDGVAAVAVGKKWGFLGPDGEFAIPPSYSEVFDFTEGLAAVVKGKKMGFIDKQNKMVIPARFELATEFSDGLACVQPARAGASDMGYIDRSGKLVIAAKFPHAHRFSEGRARVLKAVGGPEKWGFIDNKGELVIKHRWIEAGDFKGGFALVREGASWGYIDRDGNPLTKERFDVAGNFADGLAHVRTLHGGGGEVPRPPMIREGYIDASGAWIYFWEYPEVPYRGHPLPMPPLPTTVPRP